MMSFEKNSPENAASQRKDSMDISLDYEMKNDLDNSVPVPYHPNENSECPLYNFIGQWMKENEELPEDAMKQAFEPDMIEKLSFPKHMHVADANENNAALHNYTTRIPADDVSSFLCDQTKTSGQNKIRLKHSKSACKLSSDEEIESDSSSHSYNQGTDSSVGSTNTKIEELSNRLEAEAQIEKKNDDTKLSNDLKKKRGRPKRKKGEGWPKRPLSAYNIFFKEERAKLVPNENTDDKPIKKRRRQQRHGVVSFSQLGKSIAAKWRTAPECDKIRYHIMANGCLLRYREEMRLFMEKRRTTSEDDIMN